MRTNPIASIAVLFAVGTSSGADTPAAGQADPPARAAIARVLENDRGLTRRAALTEQLRALYEPEHVPLWTTSRRPDERALRAINTLARAEDHGLDPEDYAAAALGSFRETLLEAPVVDDARAASFEVSLSRALLRYLLDVHQGRINPRELSFDFAVAPAEHDFAGLVREMSAGPSPDPAAQVEPRFPQYRRLISALARYRALADDPELAPPGNGGSPGLAVVKKLVDGQPYPDRPRLVGLLRGLGDLAAEEPLPDGEAYAGSLVAAVARFQARHGLEADGVLGRGTFRALNQPLPIRVRQIEWALERLRWLPHVPSGRFLIVNVPAFRLVAFESWDRPRPTLEMNVVVGRAARTRTPFFAGAMRHVMFRPYWYPPRSIIENEILPAVERNPNYFVENEMELVSGPDERPGPAGAEELAAGTVRLRQRPGPHNALGLLKFVLPNSYDVYLHDTPAPALFARPRRDFSHGCIRVQRPLDLAEFVLADSAWTREEVERATQGERTFRVDLKVPVPVLVYYTTTIVRADGTVEFFDDLYGEDAKLQRRLARRERDGP